MDWIPITFAAFKVLMFGICMFLAIKWHYDQGKKFKSRRALLRVAGLVLAGLVLAGLAVGAITFLLIKVAGLDMNL